MPYTLHVAPSVEAEVGDAAEWYRRRSPRVAERFMAALLSAQQTLVEAPLRWAEFEPGLRRLLVPGFPYALIYNVEDEAVLVVAAVHQSRDPDAWRGR